MACPAGAPPTAEEVADPQEQANVTVAREGSGSLRRRGSHAWYNRNGNTMSNVRGIFGDRDPREVPLYTIGQAARYLRMPASTLRAWTVGMDYPTAQSRSGRFEPLIEVSAEPPARLTFNNLIEAYVLHNLRRVREVPLSAVRRAIDNMKRELKRPRPLLTNRFLTDGYHIYVRQFGVLVDMTAGGGQTALQGMIEDSLQRIECDADGLAARLFPYLKRADEPRAVVLDPELSFGRLTMAGTGVSVDIVADLIEAGESAARVAREFGVKPTTVNQAVEWHRAAASRAAA